MNDKGLIEKSKEKHKPLIPVKVTKKPRRFPWRGLNKLSQQVMNAYDMAAYEALKADISIFTSWYLK